MRNSASASFVWQICASLVPSSYLRQQSFQRQISGFHRFDNGFELLQGFFKWNVAAFRRIV